MRVQFSFDDFSFADTVRVQVMKQESGAVLGGGDLTYRQVVTMSRLVEAVLSEGNGSSIEMCGRTFSVLPGPGETTIIQGKGWTVRCPNEVKRGHRSGATVSGDIDAFGIDMVVLKLMLHTGDNRST
jgi:hypothetical protein